MRNFLRVAQGLTVMPLLLSIYRNDDLWESGIRQHYREDSPHREANDILVRFTEGNHGDELQCDWTSADNVLPAARDLSLAIMAGVRGEQLGRVIITRLEPGKQIYPHRDVLGKYANFYTRYHVPLQSDPGVIFACGDETVQMQAGEAWWFNGHIDHAVINNSSRDRLNLIVDVRC